MYKNMVSYKNWTLFVNKSWILAYMSNLGLAKQLVFLMQL
ncbi:protein of unknown function [Acetoanaerobium sticklandii]|uniref:Uncharacterized protein n=1 Tax=Acetoanaerobium sticklandii (strain ATCC 12662 / DSM 519 / JCM 1433 / CCUG 9281 / NCIMB 10654 / HF) TaxID=499177 RepID=E3PW06_ACESD|nr:protein of unknown function [Acetoanaerobium sticklandii]